MKTHDELVYYIAQRLKGNIEKFVDYKHGEMDIVRYNDIGEITEIYEVKSHNHLGKACGQLHKAREYFKYQQDVAINLVYVSQYDDGRIKARRMR